MRDACCCPDGPKDICGRYGEREVLFQVRRICSCPVHRHRAIGDPQRQQEGGPRKPPWPGKSVQRERRTANGKCGDRVEGRRCRKGNGERARGGGPKKVSPSKHKKMRSDEHANRGQLRHQGGVPARSVGCRQWRVRHQNERDQPERDQVRRVVRDMDAVGPERGVDHPPRSSHQECQLNRSGKRVKAPRSVPQRKERCEGSSGWEYRTCASASHDMPCTSHGLATHILVWRS